jgi:hypothetical protein
VDEQRRSFPDDFVLEDELVWLEGMCGKVRFETAKFWGDSCT